MTEITREQALDALSVLYYLSGPIKTDAPIYGYDDPRKLLSDFLEQKERGGMWYAVPGYRGEAAVINQPHVVDDAGELVCICEKLEHAERIAVLHNHDLWTQRNKQEK